MCNSMVCGAVLGFGIIDVMRHGSASRTQLAEGNGPINNTNRNNDDSSFNGEYYVPGAVLRVFTHIKSSNSCNKMRFYSPIHFADEETEAQTGHAWNCDAG